MKPNLSLHLLLTSGLVISLTFGVALLTKMSLDQPEEVVAIPQPSHSPVTFPSVIYCPKVSMITQGIHGSITLTVGNHMPTIDQPQPKDQRVITSVWIFSGQIPAVSNRWSVDEARKSPQWLTTVPTDENGFFTIGLPEGEYTVLAEYGSAMGEEPYLHRNAFTREGDYQTVVVQPGAITEVRLTHTEGATF